MPCRERMFRGFAVLLAILGLAGVLGRAAMPVPVAAGPALATLALIAQLGGTMCHGDGGASGPEAPARQHAPDCAICPACVVAVTVAVIPVPATVPPLPAMPVPRRWAEYPPTRAPPAVFVLAAPARGPPALS